MKNKTIDYYNKHAEKWLENHTFNKQSFRGKLVNEFKKLLSKGKILEIGCGPGIDAKLLINDGFEYVGIDASKESINLAKKLNFGGEFIEMLVENLKFPKNNFDGFWSSATLLHIPKNKIEKVLNNIRKVCKVGAIGLITLKRGTNEGEEKETGRWFAFYEKNEFEKLLIKTGMKTMTFKVFKDGRDGKPDWLIFLVKII
jgi:SAM-dependent methyltransferase